MAVNLSTAIRNARLEAIETTVGASAFLQFYSGAKPADAATAASGTLLVEIALPSDYMANAANGVKAMSGSWSGTGLAAAGTGTNIGYYRIVNNAKTVCGVQGTVTVTGGGGDIEVDNVNVAQNQTVTVTSYQWTDGNA